MLLKYLSVNFVPSPAPGISTPSLDWEYVFGARPATPSLLSWQIKALGLVINGISSQARVPACAGSWVSEADMVWFRLHQRRRVVRGKK